jgi:predicted dinucleotide-binding enzyme
VIPNQLLWRAPVSGTERVDPKAVAVPPVAGRRAGSVVATVPEVVLPFRGSGLALTEARGDAEFLKSKTGGPTAKSFNINFAVLYDRLGDARAAPSNLWCGDDEARDVVEQRNRDAGFEPVYAGGLESAGLQESFIGLVFAINQGGLGPFVYRMAPPNEL